MSFGALATSDFHVEGTGTHVKVTPLTDRAYTFVRGDRLFTELVHKGEVVSKTRLLPMADEGRVAEYLVAAGFSVFR
jgi:hypothetical protein